MTLLQNENPAAKKFIASLVKNLQAVCHGNFDFDDNVKVVGHLYLTVDSNTEFNYILNEKVSKSDESSTVFVSNSYYSVDPKSFQKSLEKVPSIGAGEGEEKKTIKNAITSNSFPQNTRRRSLPLSAFHRPTKQPRASSPMRHPMNLPSGSPRRIPTALPQRLPAPSNVTSPSISSETKTDMLSPSSIPPESVSATPAQSLPGANKPNVKIESDASQKVSYPVPGFESPVKKKCFAPNIESTNSDSWTPDKSKDTLVKSTGNLGHEAIEIDLTNIKEEMISHDDLDREAETSCYNEGDDLQNYIDQDEEMNHEEYFSNLREEALTIQPVSLHVNQVNISTSRQSFEGAQGLAESEAITPFQVQPSFLTGPMEEMPNIYDLNTARRKLTKEHKKIICQYKLDNPSAKLREIMEHFSYIWNFSIGKTTIWDVLKDKRKWMD